ncbi:MAG TPA: PAS domain-containing protein [Actinoplanes sp.]
MSRAIEWILLGAGSCVAIIVGLRLHRPARTGPWLLIAGAITAFALGDVFYAFESWAIAEAFYLANFALIAGALVQLTRGGSVLVDRARLIDLLAFGCSALLVLWIFVIGGRGQIGNVSAADVLGDLVLLGVAVRLNLAVRRNVSALLLLTGSVGLLTSDILFPLMPAPYSETGYVVLYLAWGIAAVHPSMVRLTEPMPPKPSPWPGHWAVLLGLAVGTPPVVLLIEALTGAVEDGVVIAVAAAITLLLTITRLADSITLNSQALAREQGLREASADLVSAADTPSVDQAVRAAVAHLVPPQALTQILFATDDRQMALHALPPATTGPSPRSWWVDPPSPKDASPEPESADPKPRDANPENTGPKPGHASPKPGNASPKPEPVGPKPGLASSKPANASPKPGDASPKPGDASPKPGDASSKPGDASSKPGDASSKPAAPTRPWWRRNGDPESSAAVATLICPLWLEPLAVARPSGGALVLTGSRDVLTMARDALEVLAGQAALALDRINLVEAVGRRDSDLYLRAVIRNTADLMLVIDEDRRIRYASPAVHKLLGVPDLSPLATLEELVHSDDRGHVRRAFAADGDGTFFCALHRADNSQVLIEATYRDLREDRLVQGFVVTMRTTTTAVGDDPVEQLPRQANVDELPAWVNRRSAQHKFRY